MPKPLNVAILTFSGCQVLDVAGPAMVFEAGNIASGKAHYNVHILSTKGGTIKTNSAVALVTKPLRELPPRAIDTLLIAGSDASGLRALVTNRIVRKWTIRGNRTRRHSLWVGNDHQRVHSINPSVNSQGGQKSKCRVWCRLHKTRSHSYFSSCTQSCTQKYSQSAHDSRRLLSHNASGKLSADCHLRWSYFESTIRGSVATQL